MYKKELTILIADDDPEDIEMFVEALHEIDNNIHCMTAGNGYETMNLLHLVGRPQPDIIFLDLNMPKLSGRQCLIKLKEHERLSTIPVIIFTTSKLDEDKNELLSLGAASFLTKPSRFQDLVSQLADIMTTVIAH